MKIDFYTKTVLTIIAICLVWVCVKGSISKPVQAAAPIEVVITGINVPIPFEVTHKGDRFGALPVYSNK